MQVIVERASARSTSPSDRPPCAGASEEDVVWTPTGPPGRGSVTERVWVLEIAALADLCRLSDEAGVEVCLGRWIFDETRWRVVLYDDYRE